MHLGAFLYYQPFMTRYFLLILTLIASCKKKNSRVNVHADSISKRIPDKTLKADTDLSDSLKEADSVVIVSHESTNYPRTDRKTGKSLPSPELTVNGTLNKSIVYERLKLTYTGVTLLDSIFSAPAGEPYAPMACFQPRHAVLLYKEGRLSFIDFCFDCFGYSSSNNLYRTIRFDAHKWQKLYLFFKEQGFTYELD